MTPHSPTYRFLGDITSFDYHDQSLTITCGQATVRIDVLAPDLLRVRLAPDGQFGAGFSYAIEKTEWPAVDVAFEESADALLLRTAAITCRVQRSPCRLTFTDANGRLLASDAEGLGWPQPSTTGEPGGGICRQRLAPGAHIYGLGEKAFGLERRGRRYDLVNSDPECYTWYDDPLYQSIPFFLALVPVESLGSGGKMGGATAAYGILLDNASHSVFDFGHVPARPVELCSRGRRAVLLLHGRAQVDRRPGDLHRADWPHIIAPAVGLGLSPGALELSRRADRS